MNDKIEMDQWNKINYEKLWAFVSLAGIAAAFFDKKWALLIGVSWALLFSISSMVAGIIHSPLNWIDRIHEIGLYTLLGFFLFCIVKNKQYIENGWMPDQWNNYSIFVLIFAGASIFTTMKYKETAQEGWLTFTYFLETCLFVFVFMEYIICTFFRTDGFKV
jgi:hypothetical protein